MDIFSIVCLLLTLCGNVHATDLSPAIRAQGSNATISFDIPVRSETILWEINFSGYDSNKHFTNVFIEQQRNISVSRNYTGRIERLETIIGNYSFLLFSVMFNDSGIYTLVEKGDVKAIAYLLVYRRIYQPRHLEPMILSFMVNVTNISFIRVDYNPTLLSNRPFVIYNGTACYYIYVYTDIATRQNTTFPKCVLSNREFSFYIHEIDWQHKGPYFAWDDRGRLLDSMFLDVKDFNTNADVENQSKELRERWFIISVLGVTMLAVCLAVFTIRKLRIRRAQINRTCNDVPRNQNQNSPYSSGTVYIPTEASSFTARNNLNDLTRLKTLHVQARVKLNDQNLSARGLGCAESSSNKKCDLHLDSIISWVGKCQSESANGYDYEYEYDELSSGCQSNQKCDGTKLLDTESSTSRSTCDYSYVFKNRPMTYRPPVQDTAAQTKLKQSKIVDNSFYSHTQSLPRHKLSILYGKINNQDVMESHRTRSSDGLCLDLIQVVSSPKLAPLQKGFTKNDVDLSQSCMDVECLTLDYKARSASSCWRTNGLEDDYDHAYVMQRRHRRCLSNDTLIAYQKTSTNLPLSRRFSVSDMNEDYYDCLSI